MPKNSNNRWYPDFSIKNSAETSVKLGIFKDNKQSAYAHVFKSRLQKVNMSEFRNVENFDPIRLQDSATKAYPKHNRPRGRKDISSVKFHIKNADKSNPIWLFKERNGKKYTLLDGAHRIVAHYILKQP